MSYAVPLWLLFFLVSVAQSIEIIFSSALPNLATDLQLPNKMAQLCSACYFFGFTIGTFSFGRFSDFFGRKVSIIIGISIYCIASFIILFIDNVYVLMLCRLIQAFGASACSIISQAMARDCYSGSKLAWVYNIISIIICFVPALSSSIGGFIVEHFSWRYNVGFLLCVGLLLLFFCICFLSETSQLSKIDKKSSFLLVIKKMLLDKNVMIYALMSGCSIGVIMSFIIEFSITFIHSLGLSPSSYGLLNIFVSISMLIGTLLNMYLISIEYSSKKIIHYAILLSLFAAGLLLITSCLMLYVQFSKTILIILLILPRILQGVGHIIIMPYILSSALREYQNVIGSASSIFNGTYYMIVTVVTFLTSRLHSDNNLIGFSTLIFSITLINLFLFNKLKKYL
jgi:MFS family permease